MTNPSRPRHGTLRYLLAGQFHTMAFTEHGQRGAPPVVCVHGLTRNGRDFDPLAESLADRFHVICPDLPGRGGSDWLPDCMLYGPLSYVQALSHLLAGLGPRVMWVGTSLGGICGMAVAASLGHPVTRMVLNDVGPRIPAAALARIRAYMEAVPEFRDMAELERHLRRVHAPFGQLTDAQWAHLARHSAREMAGGRLALHYDPAIVQPMRAAPVTDVDLSAWWDRISVPVLALRGADSDLLTPATLRRMAQGGASTHVVPGAGHAPALVDEPTLAVLRRFLEAGL